MPADEHLFWADLAFFLICERMTVQSAYDHIYNCRLSQLCSVGMILDQWRAEHIAVMGMRARGAGGEGGTKQLHHWYIHQIQQHLTPRTVS